MGGDAAGRHIYHRGSTNGKRVQCNMGAKNISNLPVGRSHLWAAMRRGVTSTTGSPPMGSEYSATFYFYSSLLGRSHLWAVTRPGVTSTTGAPPMGSEYSATWAPRTTASSCRTPTRCVAVFRIRAGSVILFPILKFLYGSGSFNL